MLGLQRARGLNFSLSNPKGYDELCDLPFLFEFSCKTTLEAGGGTQLEWRSRDMFAEFHFCSPTRLDIVSAFVDGFRDADLLTDRAFAAGI